jgi:hypothetical protein
VDPGARADGSSGHGGQTRAIGRRSVERIAKKYRALTAEDVKRDTRKLDSTENFTKALAEETQGHGFGPFGGRKSMSLKQFVEARRAFVLN